MNCDTCQDHLLDLVYDEVRGSDADALRAHVEECASCRASFEQLGVARRLSMHLPLEEPSAAVDAAIMRAARAHVRADAGAVESTKSTQQDGAVETDGLWAMIVRWAGSFVMGPQLAMATIMMLVVATGLWYFPSRRRHPEAAGSTMINPDHGGEAGPSASLEPAAPLDLDLDQRTGRIRDRAEEGDAPSPGLVDLRRNAVSDPHGAAAAQQAGAVVDGELAELDTNSQERSRRDFDLDDGLSSAGSVEERPLALATPRSPAAPPAYGPGDEAGSGRTARRQAVAPDDALAADRAVSEATGARAGAGASASARVPEVIARLEVEQQAPSRAAPTQRTRTSSAMPSSNAPPATTASTPAAPTNNGTELAADALFRQAQSYRQSGAYQNAVTQYQALLTRFPTYPRRPQALMDLAECYRRLGRIGEARATLQSAQRYASVATQARRELTRIGQMERARMAAPAEAPATADEAAVESSY